MENWKDIPGNVSYISNSLKSNRKILGCDRSTYSVVELSEKGEQP